MTKNNRVLRKVLNKWINTKSTKVWLWNHVKYSCSCVRDHWIYSASIPAYDGYISLWIWSLNWKDKTAKQVLRIRLKVKKPNSIRKYDDMKYVNTKTVFFTEYKFLVFWDTSAINWSHWDGGLTSLCLPSGWIDDSHGEIDVVVKNKGNKKGNSWNFF